MYILSFLARRLPPQDDGSVSGSLVEIPDLIDNGNSIDQLKNRLAIQLKEYAEDYYHDFKRYYHANNRSQHLPIILQTLIQDDLHGVIQLIDA
ncbi:hypothetical protein [Tenuibacillus multivorans]|uniref:hypothetical protein n=1 Tax=Tenuibacillus multivorans TaxID=237069 RepID=UPI000B85D615|nr:hypothetical protein [Tenuibacillus multivorans]GEL76450.1 hypothetical protein TMU01_06850 [Tenuibacillus multivorans]